MASPSEKPIIVGISGATGAIFGIELLRVLKDLDHPAHLIVSEMGARTISIETDYTLDQVRAFAEVTYSIKDMGAAAASGSFQTRGMIVAPCSMKTLSGVANGFSNNLLIRAAEVTLKEKRPLVLMVRETPLHKGHLETMVKVADLGATVAPPVPAFYHKPQTILDIVHQTVGRALDQLGIQNALFERWQGG